MRTVKASEISHAGGIGLQYAGLAGYQLSYTNEDIDFVEHLALLVSLPDTII